MKLAHKVTEKCYGCYGVKIMEDSYCYETKIPKIYINNPHTCLKMHCLKLTELKENKKA